ncbi:MAG: lysine--tRNA ligase [Chloroflexi bacterium HGW-Chloroflexi-10]|nr:MAG: lysine--tRNA ligase [Chloroflexi bacterium HGW-Chloroflexi-10]
MERNELEKIRLEKIARMRAQGIEPYPTTAQITHRNLAAIQAFETAEQTEQADPVAATLAGRIRAMRPMGKIAFAHIEDGTARIQLFFRINDIGEDGMQRLKDDFDLGDYIEGSGTLFRTKTGEISLHVHAFRILAKAVTPLPAAKDEVVDGKVVRHATFNDPENRYRQRYADLAVNPEVREIFRARAGVVRAVRDFLDAQDFLEVETPILQPIYGGAAAKPFVTYHNQLKQELYLRISFELYLKRLIVGGFDRVYEIGRDFRNEGVSFKHNPEFTQVEFYMAYANYHQIMELTENMVAYVCDQVLGKRTIEFRGHTLDVSPPWRRLELRQGLIEACGIDINAHTTAESLEGAMKAKGYPFKPGGARGKLIDTLIGDYLEPTLVQPTFLYDYPRDISPLAKSKPGDPTTVERFEGFVAGMELCNAFTELNDPIDQEARFQEMSVDYTSDDEEQHPMDEDYLRAMSYGMPPTGGFGMGIDRLVMLLTNQQTIREVLLFPHLRKLESDTPPTTLLPPL